MTRIGERDSDSLGALYDRHSGHCLALADRILKDRATSEDVLQEVFLKVWDAPERYSAARGSVAAWLVATVRSRAIDRLRRSSTRKKATVRASSEKMGYAVAPTRASSTVAMALDELPGGQREILELAYFRGLTQTEIAKDLGLPLGTVKSRLRLGMKKLRDAFASIQGAREAGE